MFNRVIVTGLLGLGFAASGHAYGLLNEIDAAVTANIRAHAPIESVSRAPTAAESDDTCSETTEINGQDYCLDGDDYAPVSPDQYLVVVKGGK